MRKENGLLISMAAMEAVHKTAAGSGMGSRTWGTSLPISSLEQIYTLTVSDRIGKGGYGEVFRGTLGSRTVAVKKIYDILIEASREHQETLEYMVAEFRRECELLEVAKHPNVVEFIGVFNQGEGKENTYFCAVIFHDFMKELPALSQQHSVLDPDICV